MGNMEAVKKKHEAVEVSVEEYKGWKYVYLFKFYVTLTSMLQSDAIEKEGGERELEKVVGVLMNKPLNQKVGFYNEISDSELRVRYKNEFLVISKNI